MMDHHDLTSPELTARSDDDLKRFIEEAQKLLRERQREGYRKIVDEIARLAKSIGKTVRLEEKKGTKGKGKSSGIPTTRPPKYRNPDNPEETWHGRGPRPEWFRLAEDERNIPREEMEIA